jgi:HNH endonuclease
MADLRITAQQRREVRERARGCCEYCRSQVRFAMSSFVVDHIVPRSAGGATHTDNLALACSSCNAHKYNKTRAIDPLSGETVALYHPRRYRFQDHFTWSDDFTTLLGITPRGRATVDTLTMNHEGVVNLRRLLHAAGTHPPGEPEE